MAFDREVPLLDGGEVEDRDDGQAGLLTIA